MIALRIFIIAVVLLVSISAWPITPTPRLSEKPITLRFRPSESCEMVRIEMPKVVTVSRDCIEKTAAKYDPQNPETNAGYAVMFKAIRDGTVKSR